MALLRSCSQLFVQTFRRMPTTCQIRCIQRFRCNLKRRGYVYSLQRSLSYNGEQNNKVIVNNNLENYVNSITNELRNSLEVLSDEFKEMRVDYQDLLDALKFYATCIKEIKDHDNSVGIFLLHCCGEVLPDVKQEIRQSLTRHVWNLLEKNNHQLTLDHYHALLSVSAQNSMKISPKDFLDTMIVEPNEITYTLLLNVAAKIGDLVSVNYLLEKMKKNDYTLSPEALSLLIELQWTIGDMKSANAIIKSIISSGIQPDKVIYGSLACGYASLGDIENTIKLIETHSLDNRQLLRILKTLTLSKSDDIQQILKYIDVKTIYTEPLLINTIVELTHSGKVDGTFTIINYFTDKLDPCDSLKLVKHFCKALIHAEISVPIIAKFSMEFSKLYTPKVILHNLLKDTLHCGYSELALVLFEEMKLKNIEIRAHYYWPLFIQAANKRGESAVFEMIKHMSSMNVQLDYRTIFDYILPYINTTDPLNVYKKLIQHQLPQTLILTTLACYYLETGQTENSLMLFENIKIKMDFNDIIKSLVKSYEVQQNVDNCSKILKYSSNDKNYAGTFLLQLIDSTKFTKITAVLRDFLNSFIKYNIRISSATANLIMDRVASIDDVDEIINLLMDSKIVDATMRESVLESYSNIPHPRNMTEQELECHLIELKSKGFNTRGVLRKLFMMHCKNNNLKRVEEIKNELESCNYSLTLGMKAQLFELYARHGRIGEVCSIVLDLQENHRDFKIDPPKILRAATALVKHNKIDIALDILKNTQTVAFQAPRGCWELLNAIAYSEKPELTETALNILLDAGFCSIDNQILGPMVRRYLLKNDLSGAIEAFRNIVKDYQKTPLRQELVSILVEKSNDDTTKDAHEALLQEVLQLSMAIVGKNTVDMDLILAYARCNMLDKLRTALQNVEVAEVPLEKITNAMSDDVKLKTLTTILDASRNIKKVNRLSLYELLLSLNCRQGNCRDAIKLWEKMQDEGIKPSKLTEKNFFNLLQTHKVQLPHGLSSSM